MAAKLAAAPNLTARHAVMDATVRQMDASVPTLVTKLGLTAVGSKVGHVLVFAQPLSADCSWPLLHLTHFGIWVPAGCESQVACVAHQSTCTALGGTCSCCTHKIAPTTLIIKGK